MKKLFMLVAAGLLTSAGFAQKFESGDHNLEMNFAPLGGAPISINGIRARMFNSESTALRLGLNLGLDNQKDITGTTTDGKTSLSTKTSTFNFNIRPGYEKHFEGTDRLSPYVGAELDIAIQTHKVTADRENDPVNDPNKVETRTITGANGFFRFGVNAVAGFDFYFTDKLYIGSEMGFGFGMVNNSTIKSEDTDSNVKIDDQEQGSTMNIGPNFNGALRLGYCF